MVNCCSPLTDPTFGKSEARPCGRLIVGEPGCEHVDFVIVTDEPVPTISFFGQESCVWLNAVTATAGMVVIVLTLFILPVLTN